MRKRKKGSTLIVVVMIFSFLVTFGGAMLAMTAGEYKLRASESKRVENLYGAESGLDVVENLIGKTFDAAVKYANIKVETFKKENSSYLANVQKKEEAEKEKSLAQNNTSLSDDDKKTKIDEANQHISEAQTAIDNAVNNEFKTEFNNFMKSGDIMKAYDENISQPVDQIRRALATMQYISEMTDNGVPSAYKDVIFNTDDKPEIFYYKNKKTNDENKTMYDGVQSFNNSSENETDSSKITKYKIKVTSEFKSSRSNVGENKRTIQANFELVVPEYKDAKYSENNTVELKDYPVISQKLMTIDGNMNIDTPSNSTVNFYGNVHVTGNTATAAGDYGSSIAYTKYKGGVSINNSIVNFMNGYLATGETFNVENNSTINADNIYARNIYVGLKNGEIAANSTDTQKTKITVKDSVFTDNDFTVKSNNSDISMKNFYGLNDKNISNEDSSSKAKTSSSIIVNGEKGSELTVTDKAVIMGVGYINAGNGYMTGESTAVKGNYLAYADPTDYPNVDLKQYGNLQLLDDTALDVFKKSEKFKKYWEAQNNADNGGISLPADTISTGAFFYKDADGKINIKSGTANIDAVSKVGTQRLDYGSKVYRLGSGTVNQESYDNEEGKWTVDSEVNFDAKPEGYSVIGQVSKKYKLIFSKDKNVVIKGVQQSSGQDIQEKDNEIDVYGTVVNAVIITGGNVTIAGNVKFTGNIIAKGNVTISDDGIKDLVYDQNISNLIQSYNIEAVNTIFKNNNAGTLKVTTNVSGSAAGDMSQYNIKNYLKSKLWKIIV